MRWRRPALTLLVLAILATTFALYSHQDLAFDLASRIWSCF